MYGQQFGWDGHALVVMGRSWVSKAERTISQTKPISTQLKGGKSTKRRFSRSIAVPEEVTLDTTSLSTASSSAAGEAAIQATVAPDPGVHGRLSRVDSEAM